MVEQLGQPEILRVLNQVEIGFAVIELDGRVRFANEGFSRVCSRSLSDLYQGNIFVFDDGIEPSFKNSIADAFREGRQDRFVGETKVKDDSGAPKWVSFDANLIRDPKTGAPESQFLIVQDITARVLAELSASDLRRKAERKIQESEERFRTLAETIPQIVFSTDNDGRVNYMNGKWFEYTGSFHTADVSDDDLLKVIHPDDVVSLQTTWQKCRDNAAPLKFECRLKSRSGEYRWFLTAAMPLFDGHGHTLRWFGSCTDIDQQKRLNEELRNAREKAERASRMKSHFLANMSHEIRTPLGAILGFTELLADPSTDEGERAEFLGVIARNGKSLSRIVDDVLDLSKVEAGLLSFEKTPFCPRTLVSDVTTMFSERARRKGIELETIISDDIASSVVSDPSRIRQIVSNLVSNAVKFTSHGFVKLRAESSDSEMRFIIEDTGIGIGPKHLNNLFQPFVQGEESLSRKYGGTGLGLYLSRKLAEALGGSLEISRTQENSGTTVTLCLPMQMGTVQEASDWINESTLNNHQNQALKDLRILVVDDAADNRLLISRMLAKSGAQIEFATNGPEGVDRASTQSFDLILMDLQMPDMDGFEATERIRKKAIKTPIVALTAHAIDEIRDRCEQTGFNGFLTKPVDSKSLMAAALGIAAERDLIDSRARM